MKNLWETLWSQKEWIFGGIGVLIVSWIGTILWHVIRKPVTEGRTQSQRGGALSKNTQIMIDNKESGKDS